MSDSDHHPLRLTRRAIGPITAFVAIVALAGIWQGVLRPGLGVSIDRNGGRINLHGDRGEIKDGDVVAAVNGTPVNRPAMLELVFDNHAIGDRVRLDVLRGGSLRSIDVRLVPHYPDSFLILISLIGPLFLVVGVLVAVRLPNDDPALLFYLTMICAAIIVMATGGRYPLPIPGLAHMVRGAFASAYAFLPILFFHFTLIFPERKTKLAQRLTPAYWAALALSIATTGSFVLGTVVPDGRSWMLSYVSLMDVCRYVFAAGCLLGIGSLVHSYITIRSTNRRKQLFWVILGATSGPIVFIGLWLLPFAILGRRMIPEEIVLVSAGIAPIAIAVAIVRHRLMGIEVLLKRTTVYALMAGLLAAIYLVVIGAIAALLGSLTVRQSLLASIGWAVVIAILFDPAKRRIQSWVDRRFFRVSYDYRLAHTRIIERIGALLNIPDIARHVIDALDQLIPVERIGLFIIRPSDNRVECLADHGFEILRGRTVPFDMKALDWNLQRPLVLPDSLEPGVDAEMPDERTFRRWGASAAFLTLSEGGQALGFLAVGPKRSGERFTAEDIDLLNSVAHETGLAIERLSLQEALFTERVESQRLVELNQLKSFFVSSVSHELKTPLTSIRLYTELLQSLADGSNEKSRNWLRTIEDETGRLERLIENVLDFAKIERGVKEYHFETIDLNSLVEDALNTFAPRLDREGFQVARRLSHTLPPLQLDPDAVSECLVNLISNAIKYCGDRRSISVSTWHDNGYAGVSIADHGIGIAETDIDHVFDAFYRSGNAEAQVVSGTGLGLALVKEITEAHGGSVSVESRQGQGATFRLEFPVHVHHDRLTHEHDPDH